MAVNTLINLPLHVRSDQVHQVVGRVVGEPWKKHSFSQEKSYVIGGRWETKRTPTPFNPELPPSEDNAWHVRFDNEFNGFQIKPSDHYVGAGVMLFKDMAGIRHGWYWNTEDEYERYKTLRPGADALAVAVGRRLVQFFGGHVINSDTCDTISYRVGLSKAKFPRMRPGQTPNERWDQFHGLLAAEPLLSVAEMKKAIRLMGETPDDLSILNVIKVSETAEKLNQSLPKPVSAGQSRKPKVRI